MVLPRISLSIVIVLAGVNFFITATYKQFNYLLRVQAQSQRINTTGLLGWYKGNQLDLSEQSCILTDDKEEITFTIIITPAIEFKADGNNVQYLARLADEPCLWYELMLCKNSSEKSKKRAYYWHIQQQDLEKVPLRLPKNAIVIFMNPAFFDTVRELDDVELPKGSTISLISNKVIILPTIFLKKDIDINSFGEALACQLMASFDLKTIHRAPTPSLCRDQV